MGSKRPLVSVIVPTYNRPELLGRALDSIAEQDYQAIETIVVNDAGWDVSDVAAKYRRTVYVTHETNKGLAAARNTGIRHASGHYIAYLDDDDWYYPSHIDVLVNTSVIHSAWALYSDAHVSERNCPTRRIYCSNDYHREKLKQNNLFPVCCVMHTKDLWDRAGGFDETLENHEDWDLWLRISRYVDFYHVLRVTCCIDRTRWTMNSNRPWMIAGFNLVKDRYVNDV